MKNVLVLLAHDDDGQEGRLQVALDVTRALAGHLTCLHVVTAPLVISDYAPGSEEAAQAIHARERSAANAALLRERLQREDVQWDMREATGDIGSALEKASDLADVIVVSSRGETSGAAALRSAAAFVIARSDRLVLAVPPGCNRLDLQGRALIAWDGSREANDALRAALPLLRLASGVTLFEVRSAHDAFAAEDAAGYLSRHGIHPAIIEEQASGPVTDAILSRAANAGVAYVVMGAFGHSRVIEALFGGVTVGMLDKSQRPLALAH